MEEMGLERLSRVILGDPAGIQTQVWMILLSGRQHVCVRSHLPYPPKDSSSKGKTPILLGFKSVFISFIFREKYPLNC